MGGGETAPDADLRLVSGPLGEAAELERGGGSVSRLLWVGEKRRVRTLLGFFRWFGQERSQVLKYICSDMWKPYLKVIAKKAGQAVHVLDRFHIMAHFSKALDEVRAAEVKAMKAKGYEPVLSKTRWLLWGAWKTLLKHRKSSWPNGFNTISSQSGPTS